MSDTIYYYRTGEIWDALYEHQHYPGGIENLFNYITKLYGVKPVYTLTYDQEGKSNYNLTGYEVIDEDKHNLFLLKYSTPNYENRKCSIPYQ